MGIMGVMGEMGIAVVDNCFPIIPKFPITPHYALLEPGDRDGFISG